MCGVIAPQQNFLLLPTEPLENFVGPALKLFKVSVSRVCHLSHQQILEHLFTFKAAEGAGTVIIQDGDDNVDEYGSYIQVLAD